MNTVARIPNTFTDRFAADCARVSFGTTAKDYTDEQVKKLVNYLVRERHLNPLFHPMITIGLPYGSFNALDLLQRKELTAGLNIYDDGEKLVITTSAWGLMELANYMGYRGYHSKIDAICQAYHAHHSKHDDPLGFTPAKTPRHHHWFTFEFETEMNTKAQLYTHTVGLVKSSQSFRYVGDKESDIKFHIPNEWRGKAENVKQGSSDEAVREKHIWTGQRTAIGDAESNYGDILTMCKEWYNANAHICNEQRRWMLPQAQMSKYVITGTMEAWERVIRLRCSPHAQKEVRLLIEQVADSIASDKEWV